MFLFIKLHKHQISRYSSRLESNNLRKEKLVSLNVSCLHNYLLFILNLSLRKPFSKNKPFSRELEDLLGVNSSQHRN